VPPVLLERATSGQAPSVEPDTPRPLARAAGALFGAISALRGSRGFHPEGVVFEASVDVPRASPHVRGVPSLEGGASHPAVVRFSRAIGLPSRMPDVLGCAIRLVDVHGPERHQDFLLVTSLDAPVAHHLLVPAPSFFSLTYSSLLPYRLGPDLRLVGAIPRSRPVERPGATDLAELVDAAARGPVRLDLAVSAPMGRWTPVAEIVLGERLEVEEGERVRFNPWNTGGGIRPTGPLMGVRAGAYVGSQAGWSVG
jgi:hypothetical protein